MDGGLEYLLLRCKWTLGIGRLTLDGGLKYMHGDLPALARSTVFRSGRWMLDGGLKFGTQLCTCIELVVTAWF